jgi:Protein of unknown function DUF115
MTLITEQYRELNRKLHDSPEKFGTGSWRWSEMVRTIMDETESKTVLDYGCGKGNLKHALGDPEWLREYDPAIPGKDEEPVVGSDLVVCTDVLEHIEPELLDSVIDNIHVLAKRAVFLVISTKTAKKFLEDGRNAHLSLHDADWWKEKLSKKFVIGHWKVDGTEVVMVGTSLLEVVSLIAKSAVSDDIRYENALVNCKKTAARVPLSTDIAPHDRRCVLVCSGPSLRQTYHHIRLEKKLYGATIVTVSGAHNFLIERGIIPDIHMDVDPREHKGFFTKTPHPEVNYYMASCSHPKTIDNLLGSKLSLWHVHNSPEDLKIIAPDGPDPGNSLVSGGGSAGCRAFNVMYLLGYRSFSIYGMDCSFAEDGAQHTGPHSGKLQDQWPVMVGDRWFYSSGTLISIARGFVENFKTLQVFSKRAKEPFIEGTTDRLEMFLHGDGLLQEMYRYQDGMKKVA